MHIKWQVLPGLFAVLTLFTACERRLPKPVETVAMLQHLQNLATVEYTVSKVVKANDNEAWYKAGDRKILITCEAKIKAGIELAGLKQEDIDISGKGITIHLPLPKILTVNMPPDKVKVAYSDVGIFRDDFTASERDALVAQAEKQMWAAGESLGITTQAKLNTQTFLNNFLIQLGFEKVTLTYDKQTKRTPIQND
jgi:hypothetical protein